MANPVPAPLFSWADVEGWATRGLIGTDQLEAIRAAVGAQSMTASTPAVAVEADARRVSAAREQEAGFNLVTIAYYFGGFAILLAYTFFVGLQWEALGRVGQAVVAFGTVGGLWGAGALLRRSGYPQGGNLLIFAGTGIVPLAAYTALRLLGIWPDEDDVDAYQEFYRTVDAAWIYLDVASIAVTLLVLRWIRFPLLTLLLAFWGWYLSMDLAEWATGRDGWDWGTTEWLVGGAVGLAQLGLGVGLQRRRGRQDFSRWFYLFGHLAVLGNASALALDAGVALGLLFLVLYLGFVVVSVWLRARVFLVFGALGCYAYACYLAFEVFEGALGFVFGLAAVGLLIVLSAVAYQRYVRAWLERRLAPLRPAPPLAHD
ncbi:MAG: hypothetical protein M3Q10_08000 [Chloroflexota bacterium]|nr:hypothetical protein [Chloroflexota bacterium]